MPKLTLFAVQSYVITILQFPTWEILPLSARRSPLEQLTLLLLAPHANPSQLQDDEADWLIRVATSPSNILPLSIGLGQHGSFGKMFPAY